ncbi:MAG: FAD-dependent monooxygenase [Actinomycetota bacterium]
MVDVAVVGGSAAGLFTAQLLAEGGRDVTVLERATELTPAARTLIVTDRMRELLAGAGESSIVNEIHRFELYADGRIATVELQRPDLIIERAELIRELAKTAQDAGARLELGARITSLSSNGSALELTVDRGEEAPDVVAVPTVIGADGAQSRVARAAGWPRLPTVPLVQAIVDLPSDLEPGTSRVWFRPQDTPYFYWLIPESERRGALGVIGVDGAATRQRLDAFLYEKGLVPLEYQAAHIPAYERWVRVRRRLGAGEVYLVGDAAGQVKVSTVGGIVTGFRGAAAAAERILGKPTRHLKTLRRELNLHLYIRRAMHRFTQDDYVFVIDKLNEAAIRSLASHDRDDASRILLSLLRSRPQLLLYGIRSLLLSRRAKGL